MIDDFKIGLTEIAAFLTIIGYSLNDTIVVFDRIREVRGRSPKLTPEMVNEKCQSNPEPYVVDIGYNTVNRAVAVHFSVVKESTLSHSPCSLV